MKKLRLLLLVAVASLGLNACSVVSPTALDDCDPDIEDCIKPTNGN